MDIEKLKSNDFKKNEELELLLTRLNAELEITTKHVIKKQINSKYPILFIVGSPRSGTTLLTQWLASLNLFCYPTNFLSRFYKSPYIGCLIQEMLFNIKYRYKNELIFNYDNEPFRSDIGKTIGPLEPHEFWYFWRRFFQFPDIPVEDAEFIKKANFKQFQKEIFLIQSVFEKPFFIKSLIINWYIRLFDSSIENPIFLYIKRNPHDTIRSILETRNNYFGSDEIWFSFKPREYELLSKHDKYLQAAGQVYFTNEEIRKSLEKVPKNRKIIIEYEEFCNKPKTIYEELVEVLKENNFAINKEYTGMNKFPYHSKISFSNQEKIKGAYLEVQEL